MAFHGDGGCLIETVLLCVCVGLSLSVAVMSEVSMVSIWWGDSCMPIVFADGFRLLNGIHTHRSLLGISVPAPSVFCSNQR